MMCQINNYFDTIDSLCLYIIKVKNNKINFDFK